MDIGHPYGRVLELGTRLGAQFVTVRAGKPADDPADFFARLAELAARYHLRPLLSPAAGTAVATLEQAAAAVAGTGGGVVLDVVPGRDDGPTVDETVVELGDLLGYVRVPARALDHTVTPGLLATLPPQVPIAIGGAPGSTTTAPPTDSDPDTAGLDVPGHVARATALRAAVDTLLRHPQAADSRGPGLGGRAPPDGPRQPAARLPAPAEACSRGSTASSRARPRAASTSAGTTRPSVACSRSGTSTPTAAIAVPGGPRTGTATPHRPGCSSPQLVAMPCSRTHCSARWMHSGVVRVAGVKAGSDGREHHSHDLRRRERQQRLPQRGGVHGQPGGGGEGADRPEAGLAFDVGDLQVVEHPELRRRPGRLAQVVDDERGALVQGRRLGGLPGQHPQR